MRAPLVASLDVLDYQLGLDQALAQKGPDGRPLLETPLRRQAIKEARRLLDAMAFRFALLDERPLPEDLDYLRALEAMKRPEQAAPVLARRRPIYQRTRRRRLVTSYGSLMLVVTFVALLAWFGTSETADELALVNQRTAQDVTVTHTANFTVTPDMNRLHVDGTTLVSRDSRGIVEIRLLDPQGEVRLYESYSANDNLYLRANILSPEPGEWRLLVDFLEAEASVRVSVDGVRPAR